MNNPKTRQKWILDFLKEKPNISFSDCFIEYSVKYSKTERTFAKDWNKAKSEFLGYQKALNKEKERVSISEEVNALKTGLKLKIERDAEIQKQADDLLLKITGQKEFTFRTKSGVGNSHQKGRFVAPVEVINQLIQTWQGLMSELGKRLGDYMPDKHEHSISNVSEIVIGGIKKYDIKS